MNERRSDTLEAAAPDGVYAGWRAAPKYRLNNLVGDILGWRFVELAELELLAFDQCIVFGAAFPGTAAELAPAARRDAVVRQAHDATWAAYRAYAARASADRRRSFARELAAAVEDGTGSAASLLPPSICDEDASVIAEAHALHARLVVLARA